MTDRLVRERKPRIACVIPTLNEEHNLRRVLADVKKHVDEIIVVDGGSADKTFDLARDMGAEVFRQSGSGKGAALRQAFNRTKADIIIMMDADGSHRAIDVPRLIRAVEDGADLAKGSRFLRGGGSDDITLLRRIGNTILVSLVNMLWGTRYTDLCYGFKAFKKEALNRLNPRLESNKFEIETEICIKAKKLGLEVREVPSIELKRVKGESRLNTLGDGFAILRTVFRERFKRSEHRGRSFDPRCT